MERNEEAAKFRRAVSPGDLDAVAKLFRETVLPRARRLGIVHTTTDAKTIGGRLFGSRELERRLHGRPDDAVTPKESAELDLEIAAFAIEYLLPTVYERKHEGSPYWSQVFGATLAKVHYLDGYLTALSNVAAANVRRGANGRRLIGAATRAKIRAAAQQYRGTTSREGAAPQIAEMIGKSPATVRKLLSDLFPGSAWDDPSE